MARAARLLGQAVCYLLVAGLIGYFADSPAYVHFPPDKAQIKMAFAHGGAPRGGCRRLSREELAKLPPTLRRPVTCPRGRLPILVELELDGRLLYREEIPPTGLFGDGPSKVYKKFTVAPGTHRLVVRLRDSDRESGFDYVRAAEVRLVPRQNFAIDFRPETGGFLFDGAARAAGEGR